MANKLSVQNVMKIRPCVEFGMQIHIQASPKTISKFKDRNLDN